MPRGIPNVRAHQDTPYCDAFGCSWRFVLLVERRLADLGCGQFLCTLHGLSVAFRANVAVNEQRKQCPIDRVFGPSVRRVTQLSLDLTPFGASSGGPRKDLFTDRVGRDFAGPSHLCQGVGSPLACLVLHLAPSGVVGYPELGKLPAQGVPTSCFYAVAKRGHRQLVAPALKDSGLVDHGSEQLPETVLRIFRSRLHPALCLSSFVGLRFGSVIDGVDSCGVGGESVTD